MVKLFKYEWKKQMFSKLIIGCILVVLVVLYMLGMLLEKDWWQELSMGFMVLAGMFAAIYVGVESLLVFDRDLRTKESHMLFMVPKSAYQILGAKILASICQIMLTIAMFAAAFVFCFLAYLAANESLAEMLNYLKDFVEQIIEVEIAWQTVGQVVAAMFVSWINMIATGYVTIISVRTVLSKTRLAGVIAFIVFILLSWGTNWLMGRINGLSASSDSDILYYGFSLAVTAVITLLLLLLSGWMAEKKLSV